MRIGSIGFCKSLKHLISHALFFKVNKYLRISKFFFVCWGTWKKYYLEGTLMTHLTLVQSQNDTGKMNLSNLVIGKKYTAAEIMSLAKDDNPRAMGIITVGSEPDYKAIIIKVTLADKKYPHEWINKGKELKYYMFAVKGNYSLDYKVNKAVINSRGIPIFVFTRQDKKDRFLLAGIFSYLDYICEADGTKFFRLQKLSSVKIKLTAIENSKKRINKQLKKITNKINVTQGKVLSLVPQLEQSQI